MTKTVTDVICPFCGTLCDDIEVLVSDDGKKLLEVNNACVIGTDRSSSIPSCLPGHPPADASGRRVMEGDFL